MLILAVYACKKGFPGSTVVKKLLANARDASNVGSIPGLGRFPGEGNTNPFQHFCLGNPMDRETWWVIVHRVAESETTEHTHTHTHTHVHACKGTGVTWEISVLSFQFCYEPKTSLKKKKVY